MLTTVIGGGLGARTLGVVAMVGALVTASL